MVVASMSWRVLPTFASMYLMVSGLILRSLIHFDLTFVPGIRQRSFCTSKETVTKIQKEPTEWERIFTQYPSDKGLISRIYKTLVELYKKKTSNPIKKWGEKQKFPQKRNTNGQKAHEKMLHIACHQGDASQNNNEISSHTTETGTHSKEHKQPVLAWMWGKRDAVSLLVGMLTGLTFLENNIDNPSKTRY